MRKSQKQFRVHKDFDELYRECKINCIKNNRRIPTQKEFTKIIAKKLKKKGKILYEQFVKF